MWFLNLRLLYSNLSWLLRGSVLTIRWHTTWRWSSWRFSLSPLNSFLNRDSVCHPTKWILSLELFELSWSVLIQEFIKRKEATTHADLDIVLLNFDWYPFSSELIDSLGLTHKHYLELLTVRVIVDILGQLLVNWIVLDWNIYGNSRFQIDDVLLQSLDLGVTILDLKFGIFQLFEHLELGGLRIVEFLFELDDIRRRTL